MKTKFARRSRIGLLALILTVLFNVDLSAQSPRIAEVRLIKVEPQNVAEFEKQVKEVWKPVSQTRKQSGAIAGWQFYKVDFAGTADPYTTQPSCSTTTGRRPSQMKE